MALKLSSVKREISDDGDWVDVPEWTGVRFKVRSANSRDYQIQRELLVQKLSASFGRLPTAPEMEPALGRIIAQYLLRGWEGIAGDDGVLIEYAPETAQALLADPAMRVFEQQVILAAMRVGDRDPTFIDTARKNSEVPSVTT